MTVPTGWRREVCKRCGRANVTGFVLSDDLWRRIVQGRFNIVCLTCLDELAALLNIDWAREIKLYPVSTAAWRDCDV